MSIENTPQMRVAAAEPHRHGGCAAPPLTESFGDGIAHVSGNPRLETVRMDSSIVVSGLCQPFPDGEYGLSCEVLSSIRMTAALLFEGPKDQGLARDEYTVYRPFSIVAINNDMQLGRQRQISLATDRSDSIRPE